MKPNVLLHSLIRKHNLEHILEMVEEAKNAMSLWFDRNPKTLPSCLAHAPPAASEDVCKKETSASKHRQEDVHSRGG